MTGFRLARPAGAAAVFAIFVAAAPVQAAPRTFVSSGGGGTACTRAAPCVSFQLAHNVTDPGGEIDCLDAGSFGELLITKSITVDCSGTLGAIDTNGGVAVGIATNGITVRLRNLSLRGAQNLDTGISLNAGSALFVENCTISGMGGNGIDTRPPVGMTARLFVSDSVIVDDSSIAILAQPIGSGAMRLTIDGTRIERNNTGIGVTSNAGASPVIGHVRNSVLSKNIIGIAGIAHGTVVSLTADRTSVTLGQTGIQPVNAGSFVILGRSTVMSNSNGLNTSSGAIISYQNNHVTGNAASDAPSGTLTLK
jgi:hypothetical protein